MIDLKIAIARSKPMQLVGQLSTIKQFGQSLVEALHPLGALITEEVRFRSEWWHVVLHERDQGFFGQIYGRIRNEGSQHGLGLIQF